MYFIISTYQVLTTAEQSVLQTLLYIIKAIQPLVVPVCFVCAWIFVISLVLSLGNGIKDVLARSQKMHQIPCSKCQFFTNNYRLKCTVQPLIANTEQAIDCIDYYPH